MKTLRINLFNTIVFLILSVFTLSYAQSLKEVIKAKGGGDTDIAELISKMPAEVDLLISINWENLAKTNLTEFALKAYFGDISELWNIGVDLRKDIKHLIIGSILGNESKYYGVIAGNFDGKKIIENFKQADIEIRETKVGNVTAYVFEEIYFIFTNQSIIFAGSNRGDDSAMKKILSIGDRNIGHNAEMMSLIKQSETSATVWGAVIITESMKQDFPEDDFMPFDFQKLRTATFFMNYAESVNAKAFINFNDVSEPGRLVKFMTDGIASLQEQRWTPDEIKELIRNVKITAEGKTAGFSFEMEAKKFHEIIKSLSVQSGIVIEESHSPFNQKIIEENED